MEEIELYGENQRFFQSKEDRKLLVGPTASGKTFTAMLMIHLICVKYAGARVIMARKSLPALRNNAFKIYKGILNTTNFEKHVSILGDSRPYRVSYPNGSQIELHAIDDKGKYLGGEYDIVYVDGVNEGLTLDEFLLLTSKARANNIGFRQVILDTSLLINGEGSRTHWIYDLEEKYNFKVFNTSLKDNPMLFNWTELGKEYIKSISVLRKVSPQVFESHFGTYKGI